MTFDSKAEVFRQAEARFERTEPFRPSLCRRCAGKYGEPHIIGGICGTCADDLRDDAKADAAEGQP